MIHCMIWRVQYALRVVVHNRSNIRLIEAGSQVRLSEGEADCVAEALTQGTCSPR